VVYVVERRDAGERARAAARLAASDALAASAEPVDDSRGDRDGDEGDGASSGRPLERYLADRAASPTLLLVVDADGVGHVNRDEARALATPAGIAALERDRYDVANATDGNRTAVAGVSRAAEDEQLENLLETLLKVGAVGLAATVLLAWFAARRTLRPLGRIADRAALITGGDLGARVGDPGSHDEIAEVARAIDAMLERLEHACAGQRRFVNDASHELRTPLTIARGHLEVLLLDPDPDPAEVRRTVELAVNELDRMGKLTDGLLRLARAAEGVPGQAKRFSIATIAASAVRRSEPLGERHLTLNAPTAQDLAVVGDPDEVEGVILNLISNAIRHTQAKGAITVDVGRRGSSAAIVVTDDGDGIDPEALPTIFDRFARTDAARRRDTGGAGLGLAICRAIVERHGGSIEATSTLGAGSTFTVLLPLAT
jgi:signal transduction histidine kinase